MARFLSRSRRGRLALLVGLALALAVAIPSCFAAPRYRGPASEHFDGRVFRNQAPIDDHGFGALLRWMTSRDRGDWSEYAPPVVEAERVERVEGDELRVTFVGHATVLIQTAGLNVLTDPVWSERASPVSWAGPKRYVAPGIPFEELPPIDAVLVSHNHYDHLDLTTLRRLADEHRPRLLVPLGNTALLERERIAGGEDLDWWDAVELSPGVRVTCVPAQHFSGRGLGDRNATLWAGFVLETPGGAVYFAGDTGVGPHFRQVEKRFGAPRLAVLPIGAYLPSWFMRSVHVDPREAAEAHRLLRAGTSLGVHFGCFELADDGPLQPVDELRAACADLGVADDEFWTLGIGESRLVPPSDG